MSLPRREARFRIEEATVHSIHAALREGRLTCVQLVAGYLERIRAYSQDGPKLNAFVSLNPLALEDAEQLDREFRATGRLRPLHGVVVSLKDCIDATGMPTTAGSALLRNSVPSADAFLVSRLKEAGAIVLGKNVLGDLSGASYSTVVGIPKNPYDVTRVPGGSSSGSGVAVAANLTTVAVGEDTFTSVRSPAAFTNCVGFRPTTGLISARGLVPRKVGIDTAGPITRTVSDAAAVLNAIAGPDDRDALSVQTFQRFPASAKTGVQYRDFISYLDKEALRGARIGVGRDFFGGDPDIDQLADAAIQMMRGLGADLVDVRFEEVFFDTYVRNAVETLMPVLMYPFREKFEAYLATLGGDVPRTVEKWVGLYEGELARSSFPPEKARSSHAILVLKESLRHSSDQPEYQKLVSETLPMLTRTKRALFDAHQIQAMVMPYQPAFAEPIVTPTESFDAPSFVPAPGKTPPNSIAGYGSEGFPMIVVPMGFGSQGLPMGISFMGKPYSDGQLLGYAYAYEQATLHRRQPPSAPSLSMR